jgi:hypothetical protein
MSLKNVIIIIDSGFARETVERVKNLVAFVDLPEQVKIAGKPIIEHDDRARVLDFTCDHLNHGTIVLDKLLALDSELHFILISAFADNRLIRTQWHDGEISQEGWVDALVWAVELAQSLGYTSVSNCSFGGFEHAMDGSGWEAFQLSKLQQNAGHIVVAAAGPGDGRAIHATVALSNGEKTVSGYQSGTASYNLWVNRLVESNSENGAEETWQLITRLNGIEVGRQEGGFAANIWNNRQQLTFTLYGEGNFELVLSRTGERSTRFDIFISRGDAHFKNYVDSELVSEPACLPQVIAVGFTDGVYGTCRIAGLEKPDIRLAGSGPISFRTPEITFAVHQLLTANNNLTTADVRNLLRAR